MKTELTGRHMLFMLIAFFGIIFAVNVDLIIKAETTFSGEDESNPYLQGIDFNQTLQRRAEQLRLNWQATIDAARGPAKSLRVTLSIRQKDGAVLKGIKLAGLLRHPADTRFDRPLVFREGADGAYSATLSDVPNGVWNVEVHSNAGEPFDAERRIWLR